MPLLICSLILVAVVVWKVLDLKMERLLPAGLVARLRESGALVAAGKFGTLQQAGHWLAPSSDVAPPAEVVSAFILDWIAAELPVNPERLHAGSSPRDLGLDSISVTVLTVALEERLRRSVTPAEVWEQPDIRSLARHLTQPLAVGDR